MYGNTTKDIPIEYGYLALISKKINIAIIGGGRAGHIKTKAFSKRGYNVVVLSLDFINEFDAFNNKENIKLIKGYYFKEFIMDKHIVVIAINDDLKRQEIIKHCNENAKLYIDCSDFKNGLAVVPFQIESESLICGINSRGGNPRVTRKISEKVQAVLLEEEEFVSFSTDIRNKLKGQENFKEVMDFILEDDFKFFFNNGYGKEIINMFYDNLI